MSSHLLVYQIYLPQQFFAFYQNHQVFCKFLLHQGQPYPSSSFTMISSIEIEMNIQSYVHSISGCDCSIHEGTDITNLFQIPIQNRMFDTYYRSMLLQTNESKSNNGAVLCCLQHRSKTNNY